MSSYFGLETLGNAFVQPFLGRDWSAPNGAQQHEDPTASATNAPPSPGQTIGDFGRGIAQEGLAGLFDVSGMLDRQDAQRDLAGTFDIRSEDELAKMTGDKPGNVMSPADFQKVARTYSDIRMDRSDIQLDTSNLSDPEDKAAFRDDTMGDIGNLLQTGVGRDLVNDLAYQKRDHKTTIKQRLNASGAVDNSNAEGGADPNATTGTFNDGVGMDAEVQYVPGDAGGIVEKKSKEAWMPMRSDITLFHELAHAYHAAIGDFQLGTIGKNGATSKKDVNQKMAEYQAAGLSYYDEDRLTENSYRKERAAIGASGVGARTTGGVADADVVQRSRYVW